MDSGTSYILMPKSYIYAFTKFISGRTGLDFQISTIPSAMCTEEDLGKFPDLLFVVDGRDYLVPKESYVVREYGMLCQLKIMTHPTIPFWILGLNFFENFYTIFD